LTNYAAAFLATRDCISGGIVYKRPIRNPIEMPFSKLKADLRKAAERTIPRLRRRTAASQPRFHPAKASNYFRHAGYA
jgi:hypothetical protein